MCLNDAVVNSTPRIGKYINKFELYRQCLLRRAKNIRMNEIENASCVSIVLNTFNVLKRERYKLGSNRILGKVYYGLYICTWTVTNNKENYKFVYDCYLIN